MTSEISIVISFEMLLLLSKWFNIIKGSVMPLQLVTVDEYG